MTSKPRCPAFVKTGPKKGQQCGNPAGFQTDHFGVGLCVAHGGNRTVWQSTENPTLLGRVQDFLDDPDVFDSRKELAILKGAIQDLLQKASDNPSDTVSIRMLRDYLDTLSKAQERAFKILAGKQYYLTLAQAEQIVRKLGMIWQEESDKVIAKHPEVSPALREIRSATASRLRQALAFPQLAAPEDV